MLLETSIQKANLIMNLRSMGISSSKVLSAIEKIPRELFVPKSSDGKENDKMDLNKQLASHT